MEIGLFVPLANPAADAEYLTTLGTVSEECGFATLWVAEHVVLFDDYASQYPYADDGRIPVPPGSGLLDTFTSMAFLAAVTSRIRLGSGICLVPQRNPVYTAKEAANVDWLSGGRLDFGVGVGWLAEEFRAVQTPFERRGARCRSYLEVIRRLWCDEIAEYKDEFYELPACRQDPKPVQHPHPPIYFGGESDAALRRVADLGQGWYGFNLEPDGLAARLQVLDGMLEARGRSRADVKVTVSPYLRPMSRDRLAAYEDAGAEQVVLVAAAGSADRVRGTVEQLAEEYLA